jgi:sulfur carrier protein ThiS
MSPPTEHITIVVNEQEYDIPNTVETEPDILRAIQFDPNQYALYWDEDVQTLGEEQRAGAWEDDLYNAPPVVVSEGDEFVVVPKTTNGGA